MSAQDKQPQPSAIEVFKNGSQYLSGDIGTELTDENNFFGKGSVQLLKHHGTYQQDDRDVRGQIQDDGSRNDSSTWFEHVFLADDSQPTNSWPKWISATKWATVRCGLPLARRCNSTESLSLI